MVDGLRQWGGSLHHNGMTLYLANVPKGVNFYHGTTTSRPVNGTEWLAFEPEHALGFARPHGPPPRKEKPPVSYRSRRPAKAPFAVQNPSRGIDSRSAEINDADELVDNSQGYLQTYRTKQPLRLIYIDGQSAAKSDKGTLDTQDFVIRDATQPPPPAATGRPSGPMGEAERAAEMCNIAAKTWGGKIDGFVRMEAGFEIILCSFAKNLEMVSIHNVSPPDNDASREDEMRSYFEAVASRYDGIGDNRATIDFDNMVSLYAYGDLVSFDDTGFPRVNKDSSALSAAKADLQGIAMSNRTGKYEWQAISDMLVSRYADKVQYLKSDQVTDIKQVTDYVTAAMRPFVDHSHRDAKCEVDKCAAQFWPGSLPPITLTDGLCIPALAFREVAYKICSTFSELRDMADLHEAQTKVHELEKWLGWSKFKRCRGCEVNEFCALPIWPFGTKEDYLRPSCRTSFDMTRGNHSYWAGPDAHGFARLSEFSGQVGW
ncbi:hypothetical protein ANO11243_081680 [Dothideomycetidae sp. 11243]|nr:hypothetical protein ANO11243_081680 [fungal sp. No.11243]